MMDFYISRGLRAPIFWVLFLTLVPLMLNAQPAEIPFHLEQYVLKSGNFNGPPADNEKPVKVFESIVRFEGVPWLRLLFTDANLGSGSYLIITSLEDGAWQKHTAVTLAQWDYSSAYFNGEAVRIELYAAPKDRNIFITLDALMVGEWMGNGYIDSQCGPTDDRIPTQDARVGRLMNIGCTAWIIVSGIQVTAGHCLSGSGANILEFNVPLSTPGGTPQHPGPEFQYAVDVSSKIYTNGGTGNDWGVFEVFDNPNTGLQPIAAQGDAFIVAQDYTADSIRITGYGVDYDDPVLSQTLQTHIGPNMGSGGTTMQYQTDTEGGNSGSPVIDGTTGMAVGVHTHGGCTTAGTGTNKGTSTYHTNFWAQIQSAAALPPMAPVNFSAYSDYTTPNQMLLQWTDPTHVITGDTLLPGTFSLLLWRDSVLVDSIPSGMQQYTDSGLVDGQYYVYELAARIDSSGYKSQTTQTAWIAGGSPIPMPPTQVGISNGVGEIKFYWRNPSDNIDGTPMDDLAGINLYQAGNLVATFPRSSADSSRLDSASYMTSQTGFHSWYLTAFDNETPGNESVPSAELITPLNAPVGDNFATAGEPDSTIWNNSNADVNNRAVNPPSGMYALNMNGKPAGGDVLELYPMDLSQASGSGIKLSYHYQPQGQGNAPETEDSLRLDLRNDLGEWIRVRAYPGTGLQPFQQEVIDLETEPAGGGTFLHSQFQARFSNHGGASLINPNDDWFIDNIYLGPVAPRIAVSEDTVLFDTTLVGTSSNQWLEVDNIGLASLTVSQLIFTNPEFSSSGGGFTLAPDSSQLINIQFAPASAGMRTGWLQLISDDPAQDTLSIYLHGVGDSPVGIAGSSALPRRFALGQNYPNPFNPSTIIRYQLPRTAEVSLVIHNLLGQRVRTLLNQRMEAGYYDAVWDGRNDAGNPVGSGIYIYRFRAGDFSTVRKMILMR